MSIRYNLRSKKRSSQSPSSPPKRLKSKHIEASGLPRDLVSVIGSDEVRSDASSDSWSHPGSVSNAHAEFSNDDFSSETSINAGTRPWSVVDSDAAERFYQGLYGVKCEDVGQYSPGGLCPLEMGNTIKSGYHIVHKLGWGTMCTVWLARDRLKGRFVALKVMSARDTEIEGYKEVTAHLELRKRLEDREAYIVPLLDWFAIRSGNGTHLCLAFEFTGPSLEVFTKGSGSHRMKVRLDYARKLARDAPLGMKKLHDAGIIVGDVSAANMVFSFTDHVWPNLQSLIDRIGYPQAIPLIPKRDYEEFAQKHAPRFVYEPIDWLKHGRRQLVVPQLRFIDLGDISVDGKRTYTYSPLYGDTGADESEDEDSPMVEMLSDDIPRERKRQSGSIFISDRNRRYRATDIYALGCLWYELRTGEGLQDSLDSYRWELLAGPTWKQRKMQHLNDIAASRALAGRLRFLIVRRFWRWIAKHLDGIFAKIPDCPQELYIRFGRKYVGCVCHHCGELPVVNRWLNEEENDENRNNPMTLAQRLANIEQVERNWSRWNLLSVAQRRAGIRRLMDDIEARNANRDLYIIDEPRLIPKIEDEEAMDTGAPPPVAFSKEKFSDFEDVLPMMLTMKRKDRATLEQVLEAEWCDIENKTYEFENGNRVEDRGKEEPWCQPYALGPEEGKDGFKWNGKRYL